MAASRDVPLALIYQTEALHQHLKQALTEFGARVVYETPASRFDQSALDRSNAEVILINLDPETGDDFAALDDLLSDENRRVVFNDGEVSSRLEGWDLARWSRHLAAKVLGVSEVHPPRPEGAVAVPVRVKAGPGRPDEIETSADFQLQGQELASALAADTETAIGHTRAALITDQEPVKAELEAAPAEPRYDFDPAELTAHLPGETGSTPAAPASAARHSAPTIELEFDATRLDAPERAWAIEPEFAASADAPTVELEFDSIAADSPESSPTVELELDASAFDVAAFDVAAFDVAAFDEGAVPRWSAPEEPVTEQAHDADLETQFKELGFLELGGDAPPLRPRETVMDLDTLLVHASEAEFERAKGSRGKPDEVMAAARAADAESQKRKAAAAAVAESKPKAAAATAPEAKLEAAAAPTAGRVEPAPQKSLADFEAALAGVSLTPLDENSPAAPVVAEDRSAVAEKSFSDFESAFSGLSLEPLEGEGPARPATGRASFALDMPATAKPAPAPASQPPATPASGPQGGDADDELSLEGLDFTFDENTEIKTDSIVRVGAERAADDMAVDLDAEIEALLAREAQLFASGGTALQRVWVLGASIGGPDAVREFLGALPPDVPAVFLLAQHVGSDFLELMVQQLTKATRLRVRNALNGGTLAHGEVVIVPLAERLLVDPDGSMRVTGLDELSPYSPSIDLVLKDVADRFGAKAGAIIFSGMAHDAIDGAKYLKEKGGTVWVQDPSTCVISSMVDGAREAGIVGFAGSPVQLAQKFVEEFGAS